MSTREEIEALENDLEEVPEGVLMALQQCGACSCMFVIDDDGSNVWVDRYQYASERDRTYGFHDCECHAITHYEEN